MRRIDLAQPFETVAAAVSSLPLTDRRVSPRTKHAFKQAKVKHLLREIYEAANGRQVATAIGLIAIAPAIAPYLKDKPFYVITQADFLSQALARIAERISDEPAARFSARRRVRLDGRNFAVKRQSQPQRTRTPIDQPCLICQSISQPIILA